jgi:protein-S-isoprenylcysteine O-methyltransferase Ste14
MLNASNIITICWLIFLGYWIVNWRSVKPAQEIAWRAPGFRWTMLWIIILILVITHFLFPQHSLHFLKITSTAPLFLQIIGVGLTVLGLIIAIIARKTLSDNWSSDIEFKKNHKLITEGIYRYIRHPIYTGIICMGLGAIIVDQSIIVVLFYFCMAAFLIYKMKKEETLLLKHFQKEYPAYMKKTKALIPFIY